MLNSQKYSNFANQKMNNTMNPFEFVISMRNFVEYPRIFQNLLNFWNGRTFSISLDDFNNGYEYLISLFKQVVDADNTISDKEMVKSVWQKSFEYFKIR